VIKIPHLRWYVAGLLFLASVINYVDRQALSVVAPVLTKELRISAVEYANILQAFLIAYTIMYVFSGVLTDRFGTRWSLAGFMVWWSVSNALHAFATSAFSPECSGSCWARANRETSWRQSKQFPSGIQQRRRPSSTGL
jgi:ACS family hexuronate transporter-like MFS transporter